MYEKVSFLFVNLLNYFILIYNIYGCNGGISMDLEFNSEADLYKRLKPALESKLDELKRNSYGYLKIEDIWNYLKDTKWLHSSNLSLNEMVSDILNCDNELVDDYFKQKISRVSRDVYFE